MAIPTEPDSKATYYQALARERGHRCHHLAHELEVRSVQMGTLLDLLRGHEERRIIEHDQYASDVKTLREDLARSRELLAQTVPGGLAYGSGLWCMIRDEVRR